MITLMRRILCLPEGASSFADRLDTLHAVIISITLLGALGVTCLTIVFVMRHDERRGGRRESRRGIPRRVEYLIIAGLLAMFLGFWVVGYRQFVELATPPKDALDVYVVGKQWMWSFAYASGGATHSELIVPVGKPVRLLITSRDVVHSFFVPAMRIKQDAVPGRMTVAWFRATKAGGYPILCAEYCGLSHSRMRGRVVALRDGEYERWRTEFDGLEHEAPEPRVPLASAPSSRVDGAGAPGEDLVEFGRRVAAERGCLRCHTLDGTPHLGPSFAGLYQSVVQLEGGRSVAADPAYLTRSMMDPNGELHAGFPPIMPSYMGLLDAPEVAALIELIRSVALRSGSESRSVPLPAASSTPPSLPALSDPRQPAPSSPPSQE